MKWFDRWFARKCKQAWEEERLSPRTSSMAIAIEESRSSRNGLRMEVSGAVGGHIVRVGRWNELNHEHVYTDYLVHSNDEFDKELSKIITMETMKL